jgi:transketolase
MEEIERLKEKAKEIRKWVIRMLTEAGSGHPGGSLSCADIVAALYFKIMRHRPDDPQWKDRDRLILSKGHAVPSVYAALALCGYFPVEDLLTLRKIGSHLQGHPDLLTTPGIEMSTGSLGQGLSVACGMGLVAKMDKRPYRVYIILGDGEVQEGQIWEAAMSCAHYKLGNICAFLDYNRLQIDGKVEEVMNIEPIGEKWRAFGWEVFEIDGHDFTEILEAEGKGRLKEDIPTMIICNTIKGKGVSFMEGKVEWHGVAPNKEQGKRALEELDDKL